MLRKFSSKKDKTQSPKKTTSSAVAKGAAVPYKEPIKPGQKEDETKHGKGSRVSKNSLGNGEPSMQGFSLLSEAAARGDSDSVKQLLRAGADINFRDEGGYTAIHRGAAAGQSRTVRMLLMQGANVEAPDLHGRNSLHTAVHHGHTGTVGVLLDYMHSIENRPRDPFVLLRTRRKGDKVLTEHANNASSLKPFLKRGVEVVQILIADGQPADDLAVFLYSVLDVPVMHAFFLNTAGPFNMRNFQRFESKARSQSLTVLNSSVRVMEAVGYDSLRCLILVSCDLSRLTLEGLQGLELLDVRYNKLEGLPETISQCKNLKNLKCSHNMLKRLPQGLGQIDTLISIDCSHNNLKRLTSHLVRCAKLKSLHCHCNGLLELPMDIGLLASLEELVVHSNKISQLPLSVATLDNLEKLSFHSNPLQNIPVDFPERADEAREYLKSLNDDPVPNKTVKFVLVGQEGVGKTTLLRALKKTFWMLPMIPQTPKTDGIDVKDIQLDDFTLRCFDCGGDVDFNETHNFFITQGALYLTCFNLSEYCLSTVERSSFLLGRLQLWLQYIFSKVPSAQVVIVGTHADHESLNKSIFQQIWDQLRGLLVTARSHHRQYFRGSDRYSDCLLCQPDSRCLRNTSGNVTGFVNLGYDDNSSLDEETGFSSGPGSVVTFPHIMGYYEVSSVKPVGNNLLQLNTNQSIDHLKDAIKDLAKRLIGLNPEIPRRWANVQESLHNHIQINPDNSVASIEDVSTIARAQGITTRRELANMLHFLKAQGSVLFFPQLHGLDDLVILDPEWLAKIFSSVVSFRDTGINNDGFIDRNQLKDHWTEVDASMKEKILLLLRHFGLCLPVSGSNLEVFPCKLPLGEPDDSVWPPAPLANQYQLTYSITFPSLIPPPFFSDLIISVYRHRVQALPMKAVATYLSNQLVDAIRLERIGCKSCGQKTETMSPSEDSQGVLIHKVRLELIAYRRNILVTVRGVFPCCMMRQIGRMTNKVMENYEGMGKVELDTVMCPGCYMQPNNDPHRFSVNLLLQNQKKGEKVICRNAHIVPDSRALLCGKIPESCLPHATIRPKAARDMFDYSGCPRLFIVLPVNKDGMSFDQELKLFVSSVMFDGMAAHLLCEFPDGYHLTKAPGYRIKLPKDFMQYFGTHVVDVLRLLTHVGASSVSPQYAGHTKAVTRTVGELIRDYNTKFPSIKVEENAQVETLIKRINERGKRFKRDDLKRFFNIMDKPDYFGPLRRLKYGDNLLWLCNEHYRQLRMVTIGSTGVSAYVESKA